MLGENQSELRVPVYIKNLICVECVCRAGQIFSGRVVSKIGCRPPNVDLENTIDRAASGQALMQHPVVTTLIFLSSECTDYKQRVDAMAFGRFLFGRLRLEKEMIATISPVNP